MDEVELYNEIKDTLENTQVIYKYVSAEDALKILSNKSLMLSNPKKFNDPFDCYEGLINYSKIPKSKVYELKKKYKEIYPEAIEKINVALELNQTNDLTQAFRNFGMPNVLSKIGVTCFSKNPNQLLMWSHYGNSHSGICIGFNLVKLYESLEKIPFSDKMLLKINYKKEFTAKDYFLDKGTILHWLKTKSHHWSYEEEIRIVYTKLVLNQNLNRLVKFEAEAAAEISFGATFSFKENIKLITVLRKNFKNIDFYKVNLKESSFELERTPIDIYQNQ